LKKITVKTQKHDIPNIIYKIIYVSEIEFSIYVYSFLLLMALCIFEVLLAKNKIENADNKIDNAEYNAQG